MKKVFLTAFLALAMGSVAFAQNAEPQGVVSGSHIGLGVRGGFGGLLLTHSDQVKTDLGVTLGADLNYTYFFTNHVGIRIGVGASALNSGLSSTEEIYSDMSCMHAYAGSPSNLVAEYNATTSTVKEYYRTLLLEVPIKLAFQGNHWYADLGVKLATPYKITGSYEYGTTTTNYIGSHATDNPRYVGQVVDPVPDKTLDAAEGDYTIYEIGEPDLFSTKLFVMGSAELGYRFGCDCGHSWQIGVYCDLGLNKADVSGVANDLVYTTDGGNHHYTQGMMNTVHVDAFRYFNAGFKISYDFSLRRNK